MIVAARQMHGEGDDRCWHLGAAAPEACDCGLASGILNVRRGTDPAGWVGYVDETIDQSASGSTKGFDFNVLTLSSDPDKRQPHLFYADPLTMPANCLSRYGRQVALLQDYRLWEFAVLVRLASKSESIVFARAGAYFARICSNCPFGRR
ncbi:hypothetical protein SAMN04515666_1011055 [Bosea lupini]|uniref:Uncharacterized protein n=1 Tax=Bosea lupini TaxID=1036779 RepID=A0A1H7INX1_9HYPH|nr:hypothetical protein [Bosea lupini]SEK64004.1 hypothetical protein SAMN04515666_1011055 [Bosea lupini]